MEEEERAGEEMEGESHLRRTGRQKCPVFWGSQAHTLMGTYNLLGSALCEVHTSSSCVWKQAAA